MDKKFIINYQNTFKKLINLDKINLNKILLVFEILKFKSKKAIIFEMVEVPRYQVT